MAPWNRLQAASLLTAAPLGPVALCSSRIILVALQPLMQELVSQSP